MAFDHATRKAVLVAQRNELTEHIIYGRLAARMRRKDAKNATVLEHIAADELKHHDFWKRLTKEEVQAHSLRAWWYLFLAWALGVIFAVKLMETGEDLAQDAYGKLKHISGVAAMIRDEHRHEDALIGMLREERLEYAGSIVLGLNDALVELTGALAGLTLGIQSSRLVALAGLVTGIAAALSMAASGYLSSKEEADQNELKSPVKAALYTGITYLVTVLLLIVPYFLFSLYVALGVTLCLAVVIIAGYTFYITTAKSLRFWPRFLEMAIISLTVAAISFGVGWALRTVLGVGA